MAIDYEKEGKILPKPKACDEVINFGIFLRFLVVYSSSVFIHLLELCSFTIKPLEFWCYYLYCVLCKTPRQGILVITQSPLCLTSCARSTKINFFLFIFHFITVKILWQTNPQMQKLKKKIDLYQRKYLILLLSLIIF